METETIKKFMSSLYGEDNPSINVCLYAEKDGEPFEAKNFFLTVQDALASIQYAEDKKAGAFFMPNRSFSTNTTANDVKECAAIWIDLDNCYLPETFPLPPSAICRRKEYKHHVYWFIEPTKDKTAWNKAHATTKNYFYGDQSQHGTQSRIRIPGTFNHKAKGKEIFELIECNNNNRYTLEELQTAFALPVHIAKARDKVWSTKKTGLRAFPEPIGDGDGRNDFMFFAALCFNEYGATEEEEFNELSIINDRFFKDKYTDEKIKTFIRKRKDIILSASDDLDAEQKAKEEQSAKERMSAALVSWVYAERDDVFIDTERPEIWYKDANFNGKFAETAKRRDAASFSQIHGLIKHVTSAMYCPESAEKLVTRQGLTFFNTYRPAVFPKHDKLSDSDVFFELAEFLIPDVADRSEVLDFMAANIQRPGRKLNYALLLHSEKKGSGKTLFLSMFERLMGNKNIFNMIENTFRPENENLDEKFNVYLENSCLVHIEEIWQPDKKAFMNKIKPWITSRVVSIRRMGIDPYCAANHVNIVASTNYRDALYMDDVDDRRWFVVACAEKIIPADLKRRALDVYEDDRQEVYAALQERFLMRDLSLFDWTQTAPSTEAKTHMAQQSMSMLEYTVVQMLEDGLFSEPVCTARKLKTMLLTHDGGNARKWTETREQVFAEALKKAGFEQHPEKKLFQSKLITTRPWIHPEHVERLSKLNHKDFTDVVKQYITGANEPPRAEIN